MHAADEVVLARSGEVAELVVATGGTRELPVIDQVEEGVQVVDQDGRVVAATRNIGQLRAFPLPAQARGDVALLTVEDLPLPDDGPYRVAARGVDTRQGPVTVFAVTSLDDVRDTVAVATGTGLLGSIVLVLALCIAMWVVIGRTLWYVESIRAKAAEIDARHLDERVPEPLQHDEIGRLARTFNAMLTRLETSAQRQQHFVADAAHELRSPVASLRAQLEVIRDHPTQYRELPVEDLLADILRMQSAIDQLLVLARSEEQGVRGGEWVDLDDAVDMVVSDLPADRRLRVGLDIEPVQVEGDPHLLHLVVRNLVENAVRHARSEVWVSLTADEGAATLTVDDDGAGIPADLRDEIFQRFARADKARARDDGGVGLGLAIVAKIVVAHGGSVSAGAAPIGGARLQVRLPRTRRRVTTPTH